MSSSRSAPRPLGRPRSILDAHWVAPAQRTDPTISLIEPEEKIKVLLESSDPIGLAAIRRTVHLHPGMEEVSSTYRAGTDLLLMVVPEMTAKVILRLRELLPQPGRTRTVIVMDRLGDPDLFAAIELGVAGFVYRAQATADHLARALRTVHFGGTHLPTEVQVRLVADVARLQLEVLVPRGLTASGLESREVVVLRYLSEGLETAEIAERMQYSQRTVKTILYTMMERLDLRNRSQAVAFAMRAGVI